jgi:hypothetical protein
MVMALVGATAATVTTTAALVLRKSDGRLNISILQDPLRAQHGGFHRTGSLSRPVTASARFEPMAEPRDV